MKRTIVNNTYAHQMSEVYKDIARLTTEGGLAYETKSAIWTFNPLNDRVILVVKDPSGMTNNIIDYNTGDKHHNTHKQRIIKLTGAKPTAFKMTA